MTLKRTSTALLLTAAAALGMGLLTASPPAYGDEPVPAAPSNLTVTGVTPTSVELTWTNNAANQSGVVISLDGVVSVDLQGATVSFYTWSGLSPGTQHAFWIASKIYGTPGDPTGYGNTQSAWVGPVYATTSGNTYVALGDSYSAGEGDGNYLAGTDTLTDICHRSTYAYPELLDQSQNLGSLGFVSCSGAITDDYFDTNNEKNGEPPQSQTLSSATKEVTLTFGGNDVGFGDVLSKCIYGTLGPVVVKAAADCDTSLMTTVTQRLEALAGYGTASTPGGVKIHAIASILQSIHALAPNARIYLADYPLLFGTHFASDCTVGSVDAYNVPGLGQVAVATKLSKAAITWLNLIGTVLDAVIKSAAAANGATFVDASPNFKSHRFCDTSNSWFNPVSGTYDYATGQKEVYAGSFHPTPAGQQSGYETAFQAAGL
jgi:lysophospholipase L1-like esterase